MSNYTRLPGTPQSVEKARNLAANTLGPNHPAAPDVILLVSEAVTNAIQHTRSKRATFAFVVIDDHPRVRVEVIDDGADGVPQLIPSPDDCLLESGRGIFLIDTIASKWGYDRYGSQGCLWFEVHYLSDATES
ncbi:ATP-binding protein [Nonomuraea sp. LPB2021202275-12-8]|uniref:ATP-binding protein n=1 Tax=Nonomuraea sp. LPB2021202275-12-8 TaxID=3120159 RepID=UPI00300D909C